MKRIILLPLMAVLLTGCFEQSTEKSKSEQLGEDIAGKMRAPIEETRAITEKIQKTREIELPK